MATQVQTASGIALTSLVLTSLSGCSSVGALQEQQLEDAKLIQAVLVQDAVLRQVSQECMRLQPTTMPLAYETLAQWWQNNGHWVVLADQSLNKLVLDSVERTQSPEETTLGLSISLRVSLLAQQQRDQQVTDATTEEDCTEKLTQYRSGQRDLIRQTSLTDQLPRLKQLAQEYYPPNVTDAATLLQSPDRSLLVAERLAQKALCDQVRITPLIRQWPREVYNANCGAGRQYLLSCQWGKCRITY